VSRNIPTAEEQTGIGSQSDLSDVLSIYDDLISDLTPDADPALTPTTVIDDRRASDISRRDDDDDDESTYSDHPDSYESPPPMFASRPTPPHLQLQTADNSVDQKASSQTDADSPQQLNKPLPKSPSATSPFAAFFGWGNASPSNTDFSSLPSPNTPSRKGTANETPHTTATSSLSNDKTNDATSNALGYCESYLSTPPPSNYEPAAYVEEMEDELKAISSELAASIRREMDLEDLVDRLQDQANNAQAPSKRTSDYFSDSGYSSAKVSEIDQSREEVEKIQRKSEQEKASIRLELTNKLQDERAKRKELDQQIKELAERASHVDLASMNNIETNERIKDLESTCEDLRRRLSEERSSKDNFEDLLSALKGELHDACSERDNLRDEVVPALRARVEGLETEAAEYANLTYESTKMQQELQNLKNENTTLRRGSVMGGDFPSRGSRVLSGGLSRSNSVATGMRSQRVPPSGLSRSNSVKTGQVESREALAERLKDVEAQRDALHSALKNLLERQEFQNRENQKRIQLLETERDRLIAGPSRKGGFEKEIMNLRTEVNVLRRRAEDALEQKWEVEKGLSGLKMDLDRAEGEIASLRELLEEKDILIPETLARSSGSSSGSDMPVTSASLNEAYRKLQGAYAESLERIKKLESQVASDNKTQDAMQRLEKALSVSVTDRDVKLEIGRYDGAVAGGTERALADELLESAQQVEQLASQVQQQLSANANLRMRLADAVARGDEDRKTNNKRITTMMEYLRGLEEQLVSAQTASEDQVSRHEEEISKLHAAHNGHLQRMNGSTGTRSLRPLTSGTSRKEALLDGGSGPSKFPGKLRLTAATFEDEAEMQTLRTKVAELEKALADAEKEMQEVITRMSMAQVEVLNLQEERDAAVRETRRLQKLLEGEGEKPAEDRFRTLRGAVGF
jgi:DNA repair exonuclease SbcCD ATPase subunit